MNFLLRIPDYTFIRSKIIGISKLTRDTIVPFLG